MQPELLRTRPLLVLGLLALALLAYRAWAVSHLGLDAFVDEAQYGDWAQALEWGYYSKPPLVAALIALSNALLGEGLLALKAPALVLYPLTAMLVCVLGQRLFDARTGFWCGLVFLTLPIVSALGLFVSTDAPLLCLWAAGMLLFQLALQRGELVYWAGLGVVVGLGLLAKYAMLLFVVSALVAVTVLPTARTVATARGAALALVVAGLLVAPNVWWNYVHGFPTFEHIAHTTRGEGGVWRPDEFGEFVAAQWLALGPLVGLMAVAALAALGRRRDDARLRLLAAFALPVLLIVSLQALLGRANGNWAAPAFIALVVLTVASFAGRVRLLAAAVACNLALGAALYQWPDLVRAAGFELHGAIDPFKRARGWGALADELRPHLAAHPSAALLTAERELSVQLRHHLRPAQHFAWRDGGRIADHYALTLPLPPDYAGELLFVSRQRQPQSVLGRFEQVEPLGRVQVRVHHDFHREASVWRLAGLREP